MIKIKQDSYKGTVIRLGNEKSNYLQKCREYLISLGYTEIQIPIIQLSINFKDKVGEENKNMMYNLTDKGNRDLCLAPEYTSVIQSLSKTYFKNQKDVKVFYIAECFRGEKPQKGRYRQFTQLGVEVINPTKKTDIDLKLMAYNLCRLYSKKDKFLCEVDVKRGLDYYHNGKGFEITCDALGSSKQVCGGGSYDGGIGFAIGVDRLLDI